MAVVDLLKRKGQVVGYNVKASYSERAMLTNVGGRWCSSSGTWHLPLDADIQRLTELLKVEFTAEVADWVSKYFDKKAYLKTLQTQPTATVKFPDGLDDYQKVGVRFLADAGRAILADDVGLGKTCQSIRAALEVDAQKVLVVTKKSLIWNWVCEIRKWAGPYVEEVEIFTTKSKALPDTRFVVTNYEAVVRKPDIFTKEWDVLIVDEATYIKNRKTARSDAINRVAQQSRYVWLLTATPTPNGVHELWALLNVLYKNEYSSFWRFVERYCYTEPGEWGGTKFLPGIKNKQDFAKNVSPLILRRDKTILKLPPVSYENVYVQMSNSQRRIYKQIQKSFMAVLSDTVIYTPSVLAQITRLRQLVCSPQLIGANGVDDTKTEALIDLLETYTPAHKILVFTTFAEYVKLLLPQLSDYGAVAITGEVPLASRKEAVERFQSDDKCRVLLGTIGAMGEGLNLQSADMVIFTNKDWVPSNNLIQAVGRAHRRGQTKPVHVISLIAENTIDEHIERVLKDKLQTQEAFEKLVTLLREDFVREVKVNV